MNAGRFSNTAQWAPDGIVIDQEPGLAIFRIVQEALTNVARHANATQMDISVRKEDGEVVLEIRDNGKGISKEQLCAIESIGILGISERAHLLGGTLSVIGDPGKGTVVRVRRSVFAGLR